MELLQIHTRSSLSELLGPGFVLALLVLGVSNRLDDRDQTLKLFPKRCKLAIDVKVHIIFAVLTNGAVNDVLGDRARAGESISNALHLEAQVTDIGDNLHITSTLSGPSSELTSS